MKPNKKHEELVNAVIEGFRRDHPEGANPDAIAHAFNRLPTGEESRMANHLRIHLWPRNTGPFVDRAINRACSGARKRLSDGQ
jgi:hypothetical protein